jgi:hypothetical protein
MYGLTDQKSIPVEAGELSTERGVMAMNDVPRARSSRMVQDD